MEERNKLIEGMVSDLLEKDEEEYMKCKLMLFAQAAISSEKIKEFIYKLFAYTDKRRPLLIGMNK